MWVASWQLAFDGDIRQFSQEIFTCDQVNTRGNFVNVPAVAAISTIFPLALLLVVSLAQLPLRR